MANFFDQFDEAPAAPAPAKTRTPEEFAKTYGPAAQRAGEKLGVDPQVLLGQWGLETGWGKSVIPGTNNLGNIKDFAGGGVAATDNQTGSRDKYRKYESVDAFADDYADLIKRKYPNAMNAGGDPAKFTSGLNGYAEDPRYADKVAQATRMAGARTNPAVAAIKGAVEAVVPSAQAAPAAGPNFFDQFDVPADVPRVEVRGTGAEPEAGGAAFGVYAPGRRKPQNNTPNATDAIIMGLARGGKDVIDTGAELLAKGYDKVTGSDDPTLSSLVTGQKPGEYARVKAMNDQGKADFANEYGGSTLAGASRVGGNVIATLPVGGILGTAAKAVGATRLGNALASSGMTIREGGAPVSNMLLRMAGGGVTGGASAGLINPDSTALGIGVGAFLPPILRGASAIGGAVVGGTRGVRDMVTSAGQNRIAESILRSSATDPQAAAAALARGRAVVPGSEPTMAQVANDPGLAQLERTLLNNPEIAPGLQQRFASQRAARGGAIDDVAATGPKSGTYYDDIKEGRRVFAKEDYDAAINAKIDPAKAQEMAPQIADLVQRPSIKAAIGDAKRLAAETGENIGDLGSVRGLDWVKKALDNKISMAGQPGAAIGKADLAALNQTKRDLMATIEQLSPGYKAANDNYAAMSRQINSMDVARNLDKAYTPVAANFGTSAKEQGNQYMKALTNAQDSVKKSAGMDRPLSEVMNTRDISSLEGVAKDLARKQYAESAGAATGSPTAQNLMSQQLIQRIMEGAGLPVEAAKHSTLLNTLLRPVEFAGKLATPKVNNRLAELALNPQKAAEALRGMAPEEAAQALAALPPNRLLTLARSMNLGALPYRVAAPAAGRAVASD